MYKSLAAFKSDAQKCGRSYYRDHSLEPENIENAYKIYQNAGLGTTLGLTIVGRLALKETTVKDGKTTFKWLPSDPNFPSIDEIMQQNLGTMDEKAGDRGSILDTRHWSLLANDAWLLGSLQAGTEIHFASPLSWTNLWDKQADRITITAREAIGITSMGYKIERPTKLEAVATCTGGEGAQRASLLSYKAQVETYGTRPALQQFFLTTLPPKATYYAFFDPSELRVGDPTGLSLTGANLQGVNLRGAQLKKANLSEAFLQDADLEHANLEHANLEHANLSGANLRNATLTGVGLSSPAQLAPYLTARDDMSFDLPGSGRTFFRNATIIKYKGGKMMLSAKPVLVSDGTDHVYTDDQVKLTVSYVGKQGPDRSKQGEYEWDYSHNNQGRIDPEPATEITHCFKQASGEAGQYLVSIELTDLYHNSYGSSGYWLVEDTGSS